MDHPEAGAASQSAGPNGAAARARPEGTGARASTRLVRAVSLPPAARPGGSHDARVSWQGFGDGLTQAVEMSLTPVLFALLGMVVDGWAGTRPAFTIALAVFAMVGVFLKAYYHYVARMDAIEAEKGWGGRKPGGTSSGEVAA